MPLAVELVQQTIRRLLHPYQDWLRSLAIRPEMLFSYLHRKNPDVTYDAIKAALSVGAFNRLHHFCAQVIGSRGAVITTNFDMMIEEALNAAVPYESSTLECRSTAAVLFKIHGTIEDPASLGLTIDRWELAWVRNEPKAFTSSSRAESSLSSATAETISSTFFRLCVQPITTGSSGSFTITPGHGDGRSRRSLSYARCRERHFGAATRAKLQKR
jgi:hypothetical protein